MSGIEDLWNWRRTVADLYAAIRATDDPHTAHRLWRDTRRHLFKTHPQSPVEPDDRAAYDGPDVFPYDPRLRRSIALTPLGNASPETLDAGADGEVLLHPFARTDGLHASLGGELTLYWIGGYGGGVFLPFRDFTSGDETYGAGRYLLDTIKGADLGTEPDGRVILDFNFAYYPSCAYSPRYVCPLAPAANHLKQPVRAGEREAGRPLRADAEA